MARKTHAEQVAFEFLEQWTFSKRLFEFELLGEFDVFESLLLSTVLYIIWCIRQERLASDVIVAQLWNHGLQSCDFGSFNERLGVVKRTLIKKESSFYMLICSRGKRL